MTAKLDETETGRPFSDLNECEKVLEWCAEQEPNFNDHVGAEYIAGAVRLRQWAKGFIEQDAEWPAACLIAKKMRDAITGANQWGLPIQKAF